MNLKDKNFEGKCEIKIVKNCLQSVAQDHTEHKILSFLLSIKITAVLTVVLFLFYFRLAHNGVVNTTVWYQSDA